MSQGPLACVLWRGGAHKHVTAGQLSSQELPGTSDPAVRQGPGHQPSPRPECLLILLSFLSVLLSVAICPYLSVSLSPFPYLSSFLLVTISLTVSSCRCLSVSLFLSFSLLPWLFICRDTYSFAFRVSQDLELLTLKYSSFSFISYKLIVRFSFVFWQDYIIGGVVCCPICDVCSHDQHLLFH